MEIFSEINAENRGLALALGFFDGVHLGHVEVIASAVDFARKNGKKSAVITFKQHPQVLLRGVAPAYITTEEQRYKIFEQLGVDFCYELDFRQIACFSGKEYLENILIENFAPISISTGFNHYFGINKTGSPDLLEDCAEMFGYKYFKIQPIIVNGETVSSSLIRKYLAQADIKIANTLLGRAFEICGCVQKGAGLASKIGFKTANLGYSPELIKLPFGVYSAEVEIDGKIYSAVVNFGLKPTFEDLAKEPMFEVHILNFNKDIYGQNLCVSLFDFIRPEKKFSTPEELIEQIKGDIKLVRART